MRKLTQWTDEYTVGESVDILTDLACMAATKAGKHGPFLEHFARKRELSDLSAFAIDYENSTAEEARYGRQAQAFLSKCDFLGNDKEKERKALLAYFKYELACKTTNDIFAGVTEGTVGFRGVVHRVLQRATAHCARVLGPVPGFGSLNYRFGPGSTTRVPKREASIIRKLGVELDCSEDLVPILPQVLEEVPALTSIHSDQYIVRWNDVPKAQDHGPDVQRVSREWIVPTGVQFKPKPGFTGEEWDRVTVRLSEGTLSFAPKNSEIYRTVEKQPGVNVMVQLALGDHMADRLRFAGVDIRDQERNRKMAQAGSMGSGHATIDLQGASDTIAKLFVAWLLPVDWYNVLSQARVSTIRHPVLTRERVVLEKFSAMGNGFTFPLETLIFWSLARSCLEEVGLPAHDLCVYGDDIVIQQAAVPLLEEVLTTCGFLINKTKSFTTGSFRESCGGDYLRGIDIRPVYARKILTPARLFSIHNGLVRRGMDDLAGVVRGLIHPDLQVYGPDGFGDGHLIGDPDLVRSVLKPHRRKDGYEGFTFSSFKMRPKRDIRQGSRPGEDALPAYTAYQRTAERLLPETEGLVMSNFATVRRLRSQGKLIPGGDARLLQVEAPSMPIPLTKAVDASWIAREERVKAPTFPGDDGYERSSIYVLWRD